MRRVLLATLITSILAGCSAAPTSSLGAVRQKAASQPVVKVIPGYKGPSVTVTASGNASDSVVASSQEAAAELIAADSKLDSIELLIQDGGAYLVQGWFSDLKDSIKRAWTRWKLSREVKAALKKSRDKAVELHEDEIGNQRATRTGVKTKINDLGEGLKEIVTTWKSTNEGTYNVETRRTIDDEGVTQVSAVTITGVNAKGLGVDLNRVRSLTGTDGTYKIATTVRTTYKDGRFDAQEWLKVASADGSEKITGVINHRDGHRSEITGTRDANGKVKVDVTKIAKAK